MNKHDSHQRACGKRVAAGVYAETRLSDQGQPIETFILDPPVPVDPAALGLAAVGPQLIEINDVWHVFDIVGRKFYPYVADMVEEVRRKGASRRLPRTLDFSKLSPESCLVLIHAKAVISDFEQYPQPPAVMCPRFKHLSQLEEVCAGLWWHDIPEGALDVGEMGHYYRSIPGIVTYRAYPRPEGVKVGYQHGIFMRLPVTNLTVIAGRNIQEDKQAEGAFHAASQSSLPIFMEEE